MDEDIKELIEIIDGYLVAMGRDREVVHVGERVVWISGGGGECPVWVFAQDWERGIGDREVGQLRWEISGESRRAGTVDLLLTDLPL